MLCHRPRRCSRREATPTEVAADLCEVIILGRENEHGLKPLEDELSRRLGVSACGEGGLVGADVLLCYVFEQESTVQLFERLCHVPIGILINRVAGYQIFFAQLREG